MEKMGMDDNSLSDMSKEQVKERVIEIDTGEWRSSMETKSTLCMYRRYKVGVKEENTYRNDGPSVYLYRARTNALGLNDFNRHGRDVDRGETLCGLCGEEVEDLGHFVLRCKELSERDDALIQRMRGENEEETLAALLFTGVGDEGSRYNDLPVVGGEGI